MKRDDVAQAKATVAGVGVELAMLLGVKLADGFAAARAANDFTMGLADGADSYEIIRTPLGG